MPRQITVLNGAEQVIAALSNELPGACPVIEYRTRLEAMEGGVYADTCLLRVPANHTSVLESLVADGNYLLFKDDDGLWQMHRMMRLIRSDDDGSILAAEGEHAYYELIGEWIDDIRPTNSTAGAAVTQALAGTRWQLGTATALGLASTRIYKTSVLAGLTAIAKAWKGELRFRLQVTGGVITARYVDILARRGAETGKRFELRKDMTSIRQTIDRTGLYTALVGRGKGVEVEGGSDSENPAYGRRLEFDEVVWTLPTDPAAKPAGQNWVGDETARLAYGPGGRHIRGVVTFDDETDAEKLLQRTWNVLQTVKDPRVTYEMDVLVLEELAGMEHEAVRLGDTVNVINNAVTPAITGQARVISIDQERSLAGIDCRVVLGNYVPTISKSLAELQQQLQAMRDRAGVWDHATAIGVNESGLGELQYQIDLLNTQLLSTVSGISTTANGALLIETADKTAALMLAGGILGLASSKTGGEYNWRTFATGSGVTADEITTGVLRAAMVKILGTDQFYWDESNLYIIDPGNVNKQIRIGQYDGVNYGIAFTDNGGTSWTIAIGHGGINGTDINLSSNGTITAMAAQIALKASQASVEALDGRMDSAEIALQPGNIRLAVGQIGGDNWIINSGRFVSTANWTYSKDAATTLTQVPSVLTTTDSAVSSDLVPIIDMKVGTFSGAGGWCNLINTSFQAKRFEPGKKYTISGRFYTNAALGNPNIAISDTNGTNAVLPTTALPGGTGWRNFAVTFEAQVAGNAPVLILWARANGAQIAVEYIQLEVGETATAWTLSSEEAAARLSSAEAAISVQAGQIALTATKTYVDAADSGLSAAAAAAQTAATNAANAAATANATLADIASDSKLTPTEKRVVRKEWDIIAAEKDPMLAQADRFTNTVEKAAYLAAFQALANYLNAGVTWTTGVPSWITDANLSVTTNFTGATFRTRFKAYYDARTTLLNVLAYQAQQRADAAYSHVDEAILAIEPDLIAAKVSQVGVGNANMVRNGRCDFEKLFWGLTRATLGLVTSGVLNRPVFRVVCTSEPTGYIFQSVTGLIVGNKYTVSARCSKDSTAADARIVYYMNGAWGTFVTKSTNGWEVIEATFTATATSIDLYFGNSTSGAGSGWVDIKLEEGGIATAFCPHSSELKSSSMEMTDSYIKMRTQEILIELLDSLNNVALSIDGTEKSLNTKSASGIMSMLGNAIMGKLVEDGFWVTSQSNWGWYLRNRFTKETANGMSITGEDLGSSKYGVNVRLGAPFDELGFIASDGTYIQKMYQDGHAKFPQKVMVGSAAVAPVSPLHVHMYDSTTGTTNGVTIQQGSLDGDAQLQFILDYGSRRFVVGLDQSDGQKFKIARAAGFANTCMTIDPDNGNAWFVGNVSVASLTDRTPWPGDGVDALAAIDGIKGDGAGSIDHDTLPEFVRQDVEVGSEIAVPEISAMKMVDGAYERVVLQEATIQEPRTEPGRNIGNHVSLLNVGMQQLIERDAAKDVLIAELAARIAALEGVTPA